MSAGIPLELPDADASLTEWFLAPDAAGALFERLLEDVDWQPQTIRIRGRSVVSPRLSAWYGDADTRYRYSGLTLDPLPWLEPLAELRTRLEERAEARFNSVLANLYRNGNDSMGWHSDDEPELGIDPVIASVSLGATRRFRLKHRRRKELAPVAIELSHGSLLLMRGATQRCWQHQLPKTKRVDEPRVNLTYRWVEPGFGQ